VTLDDASMLYTSGSTSVWSGRPKPDLVVLSTSAVDVLMDRIAKRGIRYEQHIERGYLEKLTQAYARSSTVTMPRRFIVNSAPSIP